jgi:hypothetical protein
MSLSEEMVAREALRRLHGVLDEPAPDEERDDELPSEDEAQAIVASLGIDIPALLARVRATVADHEAKARAARRRKQIATTVSVGLGMALAAGVALTLRPGGEEEDGLRVPFSPPDRVMKSAADAGPDASADAGPDASADAGPERSRPVPPRRRR